jgi:hypothetical protein
VSPRGVPCTRSVVCRGDGRHASTSPTHPRMPLPGHTRERQPAWVGPRVRRAGFSARVARQKREQTPDGRVHAAPRRVDRRRGTDPTTCGRPADACIRDEPLASVGRTGRVLCRDSNRPCTRASRRGTLPRSHPAAGASRPPQLQARGAVVGLLGVARRSREISLIIASALIVRRPEVLGSGKIVGCPRSLRKRCRLTPRDGVAFAMSASTSSGGRTAVGSGRSA